LVHNVTIYHNQRFNWAYPLSLRLCSR